MDNGYDEVTKADVGSFSTIANDLLYVVGYISIHGYSYEVNQIPVDTIFFRNSNIYKLSNIQVE